MTYESVCMNNFVWGAGLPRGARFGFCFSELAGGQGVFFLFFSELALPRGARYSFFLVLDPLLFLYVVASPILIRQGFGFLLVVMP